MSEQDQPAPESAPPRIPDPSGWSQPPAPQSPGPPGVFVDRPAAPPAAPLPPGAGSPVQPGPPMSVQAPIRDTTFNISALLLWVGGVIVAIIVIAILIAVIHH
jgi:hypothetical protein